jgi:hypothetical protein
MAEAEDEVALVAIEIGVRGDLTLGAVAQSVMAFALAQKRYPEAEFALVIGGYDDDPREVWDIPEAKHFFRVFLGAAKRMIPGTMFDWRFDTTTQGVVAMCLGIGRIVSQDPATRVYDIKIDVGDPKVEPRKG